MHTCQLVLGCLLSLAALLMEPCLCQRSFFSANASEIACSSSAGSLSRCTGDDCLLVEVTAPNASSAEEALLRQEEWRRMGEAMQELVSEDRLDDLYPDGMGVMTPRAGLRRRFCPIQYVPEVNVDRVPMLVMHATCINQDCPDVSGMKCRCKEVQQYRQVYTRLRDCHFKGSGGAASAKVGSVFVKSFMNVSVNCASLRRLFVP